MFRKKIIKIKVCPRCGRKYEIEHAPQSCGTCGATLVVTDVIRYVE